MSISKVSAAPYSVDFSQLDGPVITTPTGSGVIFPRYALGTRVEANSRGSFTYAKLVLSGGPTTLTLGQLYVFDNDFNATILTTSSGSVGQNVGALQVNQASVPDGTYYGWFQVAGQGALSISTVTASKAVESTATGGQANAPSSATTSSLAISGLWILATIPTFTANTTNGSPVLTAISQTDGTKSPFVGQAVSGTGIQGSTVISSVDNGSLANGALTKTITLSKTATANGTTITITPSGIVEAVFSSPSIAKVN